jgi:replicative DNA helicase
MKMEAMPNNINAEIAVLGAILVRPEIRPNVKNILEPNDFYSERHQHIYQAELSLNQLDVVTLENDLARSGTLEEAGGTEYLSKILDAVSTSAGVEEHAKIIRELSNRRRLIHCCQKTIEQVFQLTNPLDDVISSHRNQLSTLTSSNGRCLRTGVDISNVYDAGRMIEAYREYNETLKQNRFKTGIHQIDKQIRGVAGGEVLTIIAPPGSFKTALLQNGLRWYVQNTSLAAIFFSLEMPVSSLAERYHEIISGVTGKDLEEAYTSTAEGAEEHRAFLEAEFTKDLDRLFTIPSKVSVQDIQGYIQLIESEHQLKVGCIGIDYLGLIDGLGKGEYEIVSGIARDIKTTAKMLNLPIILLSQVSRKSGVGDGEIRLDYGRGSGAIEEGADFVLGLWQVERRKGASEQVEPEYDLICRILKNRKGPKGSRWKLRLDPRTLRFGTNAESFEPPRNKDRDAF